MYPKNDFIFKRLFGYEGNENITKDLISAIIGEKIYKLEYKNPFLLRNYREDKEETLDVRVVLDNNVQCDIDIQVGNYHDIEKRILDYWAKLYHQSIGKNKKYADMKRTIVIFITTFDVDNLKYIENYKTKWQIYEENLGIRLTDVFEVDIIQLSKAKRQLRKGELEGDENIKNWIKFLINPKNTEETKMEEMSEEMKQAYEIWKNLNQNEEEREAAERRMLNIGALEGAKEYERKLGIEQGKKEGIRKGIKQTAKKMKEKQIDAETISEVTGLTKEEIEKL